METIIPFSYGEKEGAEGDSPIRRDEIVWTSSVPSTGDGSKLIEIEQSKESFGEIKSITS